MYFLDTKMIIAIVAIVIVVLAVVIAVIKNKRTASSKNAADIAKPQKSTGADETEESAEEAEPVDLGTLTNEKTGESVVINAEAFVIGRDSTRVNYCTGADSSAARTHAKIITREEASYIVDLKTAKGTYVNEVKCSPMQEVQIKDGDKIKLADEELIFNK